MRVNVETSEGHRLEQPGRVECPLCAASAWRTVLNKEFLHVVACDACGLQFVNPPPSAFELERLYSKDYFLKGEGTEGPDDFDRLKTATAALYLQRLQRIVPGGRLLEIGCGRGQLLQEARRRGFVPAGIELSPHAAAVANRALGPGTVAVGGYDTLDGTKATYEAAVLVDVVEHVPNPVTLLDAIHRVLEPEGTLLLVTPSVTSLTSRLLGRRWMEYKPEHLCYFSPRTMRMALEKAGFESIEIEPNHKVVSLGYLHAHFQRFPVRLMTPLLALAVRIGPQPLVRRPLRLLASGMLVIARRRKPGG
jgi:SAM-dependent methyltransferase